MAAASLAPQTLALEQARAEREGAQRASWLSLVKPLVDLGAGAVGAGIKGVEDNAEARASAALTGRAGDYGPTVAGPQVAGRAGPVYERSPAEQAAEEARELGPRPGNPLGLLLDPIERRVAERYRGARAAEIAQGRQGVEREAWGRDMQTRTLEATAAERQRQDALARDKLAAEQAADAAREQRERDKLASEEREAARNRASHERIAGENRKSAAEVARARIDAAGTQSDAAARREDRLQKAADDKLKRLPPDVRKGLRNSTEALGNLVVARDMLAKIRKEHPGESVTGYLSERIHKLATGHGVDDPDVTRFYQAFTKAKTQYSHSNFGVVLNKQEAELLAQSLGSTSLDDPAMWTVLEGSVSDALRLHQGAVEDFRHSLPEGAIGPEWDAPEVLRRERANAQRFEGSVPTPQAGELDGLFGADDDDDEG